MAISTAADFKVYDGVSPASLITLSGDHQVPADAEVGHVVGTLVLNTKYEGTLTWETVEDGNGRFAVDPSTGVVTVAKGLGD